jgi:hypothetical protein
VPEDSGGCSAVNAGDVPFVVARARGWLQRAHAVELSGAELDLVGRGVLLPRDSGYHLYYPSRRQLFKGKALNRATRSQLVTDSIAGIDSSHARSAYPPKP